MKMKDQLNECEIERLKNRITALMQKIDYYKAQMVKCYQRIHKLKK